MAVTTACVGLPACAVNLQVPGTPASGGHPAVTRGPTVEATPALLPPVGLSGEIRGLDGKPAARVRVRLIPLPGAGPAPQSTETPEILAVTDGAGRFRLDHPPEGAFNLEAVLSADVKVLKPNLRFQTGTAVDVGTLALARIGSIRGKLRSAATGSMADLLGADVYVPGTSYASKVDALGAFEIAHVPPGTFTLLAEKPGLGRAVASDLIVRPGEATEVADLTLTLAPPVILGLDPLMGGPGQVVHMSGSGLLGNSAWGGIQVTIGGLPALVVAEPNDRQAAFMVPPGARTGDVAVEVAGIRSNPYPFLVLKQLSVSPRGIGLLVGATAAVAAKGLDSGNLTVAAPAVSWSADGPAATVSAGVVRGASAGQVTIAARSGSLLATTSVTVFSARVTGVSVPATARVGNLWSRTTTIGAANVMSDGSTNSFVSYDVFPSASFSVSPDGLLTARDSTSNARGLLTVRSLLDPGHVATSAIDLWNYARVTTLAGTGIQGYRDGPRSQAQFTYPSALAVDGAGTVYVADSGNHRIRRITGDGTVSSLAGSGTAAHADGVGSAASFKSLVDIAIGPDGDLYVADHDGNRVRKVSRTGEVTTFAGSGVAGHRDGMGIEAELDHPRAIAIDRTGNLFVTETNIDPASGVTTSYLRKISPAGMVTTVFGGTSTYLDGPLQAARGAHWAGVAWNPADGLLYFPQPGAGALEAIRRVSPEEVSTYLESTPGWTPEGLPPGQPGSGSTVGIAADSLGNLYRFGTAVVRITPDRAFVTLAGSRTEGFADGVGSAALFSYSCRGQVQEDGTIVLADSGNHRVRLVTR